MPRRPSRPPRDVRHAIGRAATTAPGSGNETDESGDWLAERGFDSQAEHAPPDQGTPLDTDRRATTATTARESRRGKHRSG